MVVCSNQLACQLLQHQAHLLQVCSLTGAVLVQSGLAAWSAQAAAHACSCPVTASRCAAAGLAMQHLYVCRRDAASPPPPGHRHSLVSNAHHMKAHVSLCSGLLQVDGERDAVLEEPMLLRQQLEGSALPNEFKRAHFISPHWDEVLLDVNRTVQVTKGGKVGSCRGALRLAWMRATQAVHSIDTLLLGCRPGGCATQGMWFVLAVMCHACVQRAPLPWCVRQRVLP